MSGLTLDAGARIAQVETHPPQRLTHLEFRLLYTLMSHRGQVLPPELIVERVWGYGDRGDKELVRGLVSRVGPKIEPDRANRATSRQFRAWAMPLTLRRCSATGHWCAVIRCTAERRSDSARCLLPGL